VTTRWIIGFDTSTPRTVIALGHIDADGSDVLVAEHEEDDGAGQASARLVPRLQAMLDQVGITPSSLHAVACGRGPGTFTGTRVAIATAKGLALGLGLPLWPISTLHALAFTRDTEGLVLALLDARRGEVYSTLVELGSPHARPRLTSHDEERVTTVAELVERHAAHEFVTAIGPAVAPYAAGLPVAWRERAILLHGPSPRGLWRATVLAEATVAASDPATVHAVYLRQSYAELGLNVPKRPMVKSPFVDET